MYIGLSLSNCVADILAGKVNIEDVAFIVAGTLIKDEKSFNHVVDSYGESYWREFSYSSIMDTMKTLFFSGRFFQPRIMNADTCFIGSGHWIAFNPDRLDEYINYINECMRVKF